ncbi:serine hydrolase domain-containing protein [Nocardia tengchongensis]|uniref:serine hydrolase domain-containing protein n=1 Tax=Nocardia tengchongensis TaxID=2055889 RepID=UPI0036C05C7D
MRASTLRRSLAGSGKPGWRVAALAAAAVVLANPVAAHADITTATTTLQSSATSDVPQNPGVVGLVRSGDSIQYVSAGNGQVNPNVPADPKATFRIGSVTKTFTAAVVLQLEAEHKLSLADTVDTKLPGLIQNLASYTAPAVQGLYPDTPMTTKGIYDGKSITIRQLLGHRSGLPNHTDDLLPGPFDSPGKSGYPYSEISLVNDALHLDKPSGTGVINGDHGYHYSNTNFVLAGMIVEAVTGHSLQTEIQNRIITPLGLKNTTYPTGPAMVGNTAGNYLHGYVANPFNPWFDESLDNPSLFGGSGAIISNLDDLSTFVHALLDGQLLPGPQLAELKTTVPIADAFIDYSNYSLGLGQVTGLSCGSGWGHDGVLWGYFTSWIANDDGSKQVILFTNRQDGQTGIFANTGIAVQARDAFCKL